jgi:hypothetical protein
MRVFLTDYTIRIASLESWVLEISDGEGTSDRTEFCFVRLNQTGNDYHDSATYPDPIPEPNAHFTVKMSPERRTVPKNEFPDREMHPDSIPEPDEQLTLRTLFTIPRFITLECPKWTKPDPIPGPLIQEDV